MSILTFYLGRKGTTGDSGLDGVGTEDVRTGLIENPIFSAFHQNNLSDFSPVEWSRSASGSITNRYLGLDFVGGDTLSNILPWSEDFSQWSDVGGYWSIINSNVNDPIGGTDAKRIELDSSTFPSGVNVMGVNYSTTEIGQHTFSFYIRSVVGTVENVGIQLTTGGTVFTLSDPVTSTYQRISITLLTFAPVTDSFYINVYGLSGVQFDIFGAQLTFDPQAVEYVKTTGTSVSGPNTQPRQRANNFGYLIEQGKSNFISYSENLLAASWIVSGGSISKYPEPNPKGTINGNSQIDFTSPNCTLFSDAAYTEGEQYTVSFWVAARVGEIGSINVSVANGDSVAITRTPTTEFARVSATCIAGSSSGVSITFTVSDQLTKAGVFGIQAESGGLSSYIATIDDVGTRTDDLVTCAYEPSFPRPSSSWTLLFTYLEINDTSDNRYIFHNGLTGVDEFSAKMDVDGLKIVNGTSLSAFDFNFGNAELVFDGITLFLYSNAELISSTVITGATSELATTMFLGSDENQTNQANAFISSMYFYDEALTIDELRYIRGSDA